MTFGKAALRHSLSLIVFLKWIDYNTLFTKGNKLAWFRNCSKSLFFFSADASVDTQFISVLYGVTFQWLYEMWIRSSYFLYFEMKKKNIKKHVLIWNMIREITSK